MYYFRTPIQIFTAQLVNQTFNARVNYTNRNGKNHISDKWVMHIYIIIYNNYNISHGIIALLIRQLFTAFIGAITGAVSISIILNNLTKVRIITIYK